MPARYHSCRFSVRSDGSARRCVLTEMANTCSFRRSRLLRLHCSNLPINQSRSYASHPHSIATLPRTCTVHSRWQYRQRRQRNPNTREHSSRSRRTYAGEGMRSSWRQSTRHLGQLWSGVHFKGRLDPGQTRCGQMHVRQLQRRRGGICKVRKLSSGGGVGHCYSRFCQTSSWAAEMLRQAHRLALGLTLRPTSRVVLLLLP
ncbi:hypothetical protein BJ741DRAFT_603734 [Chytriomyces cf. hyalinus JEL632]|nr:hypothetical protein BJ741DRAFT_603734 [Chytriomyces cf. hyalinus JEL632]